MQNLKTITKANTKDILRQIYNHIETVIPNIEILEDANNNTSFSQYWINRNPRIIIGTAKLNVNTESISVNTKYTAYLCTIPFHETKHILQFTKEIPNAAYSKDKILRQIAFEHALHTYFPEHYTATYINAPIEIAAELYGFEKAKAFFDDNPHMKRLLDFNTEIGDAIMDKQLIPRWYAPRNPNCPPTNIDLAITALESNLKNKANPKNRLACKHMENMGNPYALPVKYPLMKDMRKDTGFISKLNDAKTLYDQQLLLLDAIRIHDYDYFLECKQLLPLPNKYMLYFNDAIQQEDFSKRNVTVSDEMQEYINKQQSFENIQRNTGETQPDKCRVDLNLTEDGPDNEDNKYN